MTMEDLYIEMKAVLNFFNLKWNQMDQVQIESTEGVITFIFEGRYRVSVTTGNVGDKPNEGTTKI